MDKQQDTMGVVGVAVSGVGAIVGIVFAITTQNVGLISAPLLAVGVGCNFLSRKQLNDSLVEAYNKQEQTINDLMQTLDKNHQELTEKIVQNKGDLGTNIEKLQQSLITNLEQQKEHIAKEIQRIDLQHQELNNVVTDIKEIENLSQGLRVKPDSADFFYQRGVGYEKLGNKNGAIEDYTEAIKKDRDFAKAYHKRGVLYLDTGLKQRAVDDLRKAALLYFEQGDIDSYHQAREMSRNIHELRSDSNGNTPEMVIGTRLFPEQN
ncbi:tetratricopeptide repeat protein [Geminocystis sp. CENA526]|uniref:tetratricopeptide repeat protein n=1 Tax=Geminocystis sp. CENA526 TaxID=1355871 RepID=UPI003D6F3411